MRFGGEEGVTIEGLNGWHENVWHAPKSLVEWGLGVFCVNLNL
jgi:hypothetical protein